MFTRIKENGDLSLGEGWLIASRERLLIMLIRRWFVDCFQRKAAYNVYREIGDWSLINGYRPANDFKALKKLLTSH